MTHSKRDHLLPQPYEYPSTNVQLTRRGFVLGATSLAVGLMLPTRARAASAEARESALSKSPLVYISPLRANGSESKCHGEVWFVEDGKDIVVVTEPGRWRAAAIGQGLDRARIWVGDFGVWTKSDGAFKKAPSYLALGSVDMDTAAHARALVAFGAKYTKEWSKWGPRFQKGLASGQRVLLRYRPV